MEWEHPDPYEHEGGGMPGGSGDVEDDEHNHNGDGHLASDPNCQRSSSWRDMLFSGSSNSQGADGGDGEGGAPTGVRSRPGKGSGGGRQRQQNRSVIVRAPSNWAEAISAVGEAMRFTYAETLSKWPMLDLVLGLRYMTRRHNHQGEAFADPRWKVPRAQALPELAPLGRLLQLCAETSRKKFTTLSAFIEAVGLTMADVLDHNLKAGVLKPAYILLREDGLNAVVLVIRGTQSVKDTLTAITGSVVPFHHTLVADGDGSLGGGEKVREVVLGYAHCGMVVAARWFLDNLAPTLRQVMEQHTGRRLLIVGHSLGGGTAAILTCMLRETAYFKDTTCVTFAPAACMTWELSESCNAFVTSVVHGCDIVPTFSAASLADLREEVRHSSWSDELRADMDAMRLMRLVKGSATAVKGKLALLTNAATLRLTKSGSSIAVNTGACGAGAGGSSDATVAGVEAVSSMASSQSLVPVEPKQPQALGALQSTAQMGCMGVSWLLATSSRGSSSASAALSSFSGAMKQRLHTLITSSSSSSAVVGASSALQGQGGSTWPAVPGSADDSSQIALLAEERDALLACGEVDVGGASSGEEESERGADGSIGLGCASTGGTVGLGRTVTGDSIAHTDGVVLEANEEGGSGSWATGGKAAGASVRGAGEGDVVTVASVAGELCRMGDGMEEDREEGAGVTAGGGLLTREGRQLVAHMSGEHGLWHDDAAPAIEGSAQAEQREQGPVGGSVYLLPPTSSSPAGVAPAMPLDKASAGGPSSGITAWTERPHGRSTTVPLCDLGPGVGTKAGQVTSRATLAGAGASSSITRRRGARSGSPNSSHRRANSASAAGGEADGNGFFASTDAGGGKDGVLAHAASTKDGYRSGNSGGSWGLASSSSLSPFPSLSSSSSSSAAAAAAAGILPVLASALPPMRMRREGSAPSLVTLPCHEGSDGDVRDGADNRKGGSNWGDGTGGVLRSGEKRAADTRPNGALVSLPIGAAPRDDRSALGGSAVPSHGGERDASNGAGGSKRACVEDGAAQASADVPSGTRTARLSEDWVDMGSGAAPNSASPSQCAGASRNGDAAAPSSGGGGSSNNGVFASSRESDERERWYPPGRVLHFVREPLPAGASKPKDADKEAVAAGRGHRFWDTGKDKQPVATGAGADDQGSGSVHGASSVRRIELYMPDKRTYGKLRLGATQVSDHYLPHYMAAFRDYFGQREELEVSTAPTEMSE